MLTVTLRLRIEFSRPKNPKIHEDYLVRIISDDDVIATDKTSKASTGSLQGLLAFSRKPYEPAKMSRH